MLIFETRVYSGASSTVGDFGELSLETNKYSASYLWRAKVCILLQCPV